jgi:alpha-beta hydrolase superfamily lysophospholipase
MAQAPQPGRRPVDRLVGRMIRVGAKQAMLRSPVFAGRQGAPRGARRWRARLAAALLAAAPILFLATCGPAADPPGRVAGLAPPLSALPSAGPARFTDRFYIADDGARLPLRRWLPAGRVKAVILALHGFNDYSRSFAGPARLWARRGIASYAYDQRGFGGAPDRGGWVGEGRLAVDAIVAGRILRRRYPGRPLYLLGESMGGAVAILAMTGAMKGVVPGPAGMPRADADGIILCAPAVWGRATMELLPKALLFLAARFLPQITLTGRGLRILASDNLPMLRALGRDPMVLKGARVATIWGLVNLMDDALAAAPRLAAPLLLMYGAHDELVPRPAIADFVAQLPPARGAGRRLAYYRHGYHLLLRDLDGALVARDVAGWILDRAAPLPSAADAAERARPWPPQGTAGRPAGAVPPAGAGLAPAGARR